MTRRANNEGSVYHDEKKDLYVVQVSTVRPNGRKARPKFYFKTQKEAIAAKTRILNEIRKGQFVFDDGQTVAQFLEQWLRTTVAMRNRPRTYESYAGLLRLHVIPGLGAVKLGKLTPLQVQRLLNEKLASGLSAATVERIRDVFRNALNQAVRWELIGRNVAQLADPPKVEAVELTPWSLEEARSFLQAVWGDRLAAAFLVTAVTGMRRGEILGLRWEDVDLETGVLEVRGSIQRINGEGLVRTALKTIASRRKLAIAPFICAELRRHRDRQDFEREFAGSKWVETGYVFTCTIGTPLDPRNLTRRFQALGVAVGVPRQRFHDLRHFAASVQLMDGAPLNAVQQQLGHSKASTTLDIYAHVTQVVHRDRAERMAELLSEGFDPGDPGCPPNCPPELAGETGASR